MDSGGAEVAVVPGMAADGTKTLAPDLALDLARGQCYKTFLSLIYDFRNKLVFVPGKPFQPSLMFVGKARAYPS